MERFLAGLLTLLLVGSVVAKIAFLVRVPALQGGAADPVFPFLPAGAVLVLALVVESAVLGWAAGSASLRAVADAYAWLAVMFLGYHLVLWAAGEDLRCPCFGFWLPVSPVGRWAEQILAAVFMVGAWCLWWRTGSRRGRRGAPAGEGHAA